MNPAAQEVKSFWDVYEQEAVKDKGQLVIPYILTAEEETRAIQEKEISLRNHKRWTLTDKGCHHHQAERMIEDIDWTTMYDRDEVLAKANKLKYWKLEEEKAIAARKQKLIEDRQRLLDVWTAEKVHGKLSGEIYRREGQEIIHNEHTTPLIKAICFRIADDPRFQTELGLDPSKGLLLRGNPGLGKSFLVECLADNPRHPIRIHSMIAIAAAVRESGKYYTPAMGRDDLICIDDVGTEYDQTSGRTSAIKHYGTDVNWFKNFIETMYKAPDMYARIIISTNDSFEIMEAKYGFRVRSRIPQMFNIINVSGPDMRKRTINTLNA